VSVPNVPPELPLFAEEPLPLQTQQSLPEFPLEALPPVIRDMVAGVSLMTQTDPGMAATSALTAIAAATAGRAGIRIRPGWDEGLNIFTLTVAAPGERKSVVQRNMAGPLYNVERELIQRSTAERAEAQVRKDVAGRQADSAKRIAGNGREGDPDTKLAEAIGAAQYADAIIVPPEPRLVADDVTPEALASLLSDNEGRMSVISDEGGIFDTLAGRYSNNVPNLDVFLKGHSQNPMRVDRRGRPAEVVARPSLTVGLMVQPQALAGAVQNAAFRGRGLLARFLFCYPLSRVGRRKIAQDPVAEDVVNRYGQLLAALALDMHGRAETITLTLTKDASDAVIALETEIEPELGPAGELGSLADWGAKFVGAICRIAGLLHFAEHGVGGVIKPVSARTISAAGRIGMYYKAHAMHVLAAVVEDPTVADARYLLEIIKRRGWTTFTTRELMRTVPRGRFKKTPDLDAPLGLLDDNGWIEREPQQSAAPHAGRPPSPTWLVHPSALSALSADPTGTGYSADCVDFAEEQATTTSAGGGDIADIADIADGEADVTSLGSDGGRRNWCAR
jgi:hypothetical protein